MIANFWEQSVYGDAINESHSLLLQQVDHGCLQVANISHKALKVLFGLDMGRLPFLWCRDWGQRISDLGKGVGQVVEGSPVLHFIASGAKVKVRAVEALEADTTNGSVTSTARSGVSNSVCLTNKLGRFWLCAVTKVEALKSVCLTSFLRERLGAWKQRPKV